MTAPMRWAGALLAALLLAPPVVLAAGPEAPIAMAPNDARALMARIADRLEAAPVVSGRFQQSKTIQGFKNPLVSSGTFVMARGQGITWHTMQPFESKLQVTPRVIFSQQAGGPVSTMVGPGEEPALRAVNELLFAIMAADVHVLAEKFDIAGRLLDEKGWTLELTPRDAMLQQWLSRVALQGGAYVEKVSLDEARGDRSVIRLSQHESSARMPDAQ